jgi:hypothetical protein
MRSTTGHADLPRLLRALLRGEKTRDDASVLYNVLLDELPRIILRKKWPVALLGLSIPDVAADIASRLYDVDAKRPYARLCRDLRKHCADHNDDDALLKTFRMLLTRSACCAYSRLRREHDGLFTDFRDALRNYARRKTGCCIGWRGQGWVYWKRIPAGTNASVVYASHEELRGVPLASGPIQHAHPAVHMLLCCLDSLSVYSLSEGKYSLRHVIDGYFFTGADIRRNFFSSTRNKVMHFNGLDWHDVTPEGLGSASHRFPIEDALYLDGTLFLVTLHGYKTLIYRGKHIK